jgi:hypothetical protein
MKNERLLRHLRFLLFSLVLVLTFEGLLRKMAPKAGEIALFFLKDFVVGLIWIYVLLLPKARPIQFFLRAYSTIAILFLPVVIITALHDPLLALFGMKQYLLFPVVAIGMFLAFEDASPEMLMAFARWSALLVIPTSLVALLESRLPPDHWLNLSVGGQSLEGFSAAGELRVSSTFPFVAQYCMFLNAQLFFVLATVSQMKSFKGLWKLIYFSLPVFLILGSYITGSRTAVVGNTVILGLGLLLVMSKGQAGRAVYASFLVVVLYIAFVVLQHYFPSSFAAYSEREEGRLLGFSDEVQTRTSGAMFGWFTNYLADAPPSFFGYGLGVMSNGSDSFSAYARSWRGGGGWTETDYATTLFEGGFYLMVVWYGFRYFIIFETTRRYLAGVSKEFVLPAAFCQGYVILTGFQGTLAIQPPAAIWWYLAVGASLLFWWKSVESHPENPQKAEDRPPALGARTFRGRSAYAERLHSGNRS